jgi:hypothetical protein
LLDLILLSDIKLIGITHGVQKPGFLQKYFVTSRRFGKKPGFFGRSA